MVKHFKDFLDINKRIGKMLICGLEGFGKTLLLAYIAKQKMLIGEQECYESYEIVDRYNQLGYSFSKNYEHLVFCAYITVNCNNTPFCGRKSYGLNPYKLGLYDKNHDTDLYPPMSTLCISEAQIVFNSYKQEKIRPSFFRYFETSRQGHLSLIMDCQRFMLIAKNVRDLVNRFILLTKEVEHIKDKDGNVIGHKLFVLEFKSNKDVELYDSTGNKNNAEEYILILDDCVFDNYDSWFFEFVHLRGRYKQDFHIEYYPDVTDIDELERLDSLLDPKDFYINSKEEKEGKQEFAGPTIPEELMF